MRKDTCKLCGRDDFYEIGKRLFSTQTKKNIFNFSVNIVCCKYCGLVFQSPCQNAVLLRRYYQFMFRDELCRSNKIKQIQFYPRAAFGMKFLNKRDSIFEIGCADGLTLSLFKKKGMNVRGIEPSLRNAAYCRCRGLEVFPQTYQEFYRKNKKIIGFDMVCNFYMLEHIVSPVDFLFFCNRILKKRGVLFIEIPVIENYIRSSSAYDLLFFFEHQTHFSIDTIRLLLMRCGFDLIEYSNDNATTSFGMCFVARKVSKSIKAKNLEISPKTVSKTMQSLKNIKQFSKDKILALRKRVKSLLPGLLVVKKNIVIFGGGEHTKMLLSFPEFKNTAISCIADNNSERWGMNIGGIPVCRPEDALRKADAVIISSASYQEEIYQQLLEMRINPAVIIKLYDQQNILQKHHV